MKMILDNNKNLLRSHLANTLDMMERPACGGRIMITDKFNYYLLVKKT